jgi:uncharacterized protein (TIGR03437 family)
MKKLSIACGLLIASGSLFAQQYGITTIAGSGTTGWSGDLGPALSAQFSDPIRVAVDAAGNVYLTDYGNSSIRKVFTDGTVNSVTGNGSSGFSGDGGSAVGAQISSPHDIAIDASGNLYIADTGNTRVRRIDASGNISTFAGNGIRGYNGDGGPATSAQMLLPTGVAVDSKGNVYIADAGNASVRKVSPNGIISTFAGTGFLSFGAFGGEGGPATAALLGTPYSLATDNAGNVYIGDIGLNRLFRVSTDGLIHTVATNFNAQSFALDSSGNIYFASYTNHTVQKIIPGGTILWIAGDGAPGYSGDFGVGTGAQMSQPYGVAVDKGGNVFVAEAANAIIRKLTPRTFSIGAIANAATVAPFALPPGGFGDATVPISPGEIVVLFGTGLGPANIVSNTPVNGAYSTQLAGTQVKFAGIPAPILYTSSGLVSAIVPYGVNGLQTADVAVIYQGNQSLVNTVPVAATAPGLFTANASGSGAAVAVNLDGTLNGSTNPVRVGGFVILYATGEGITTPSGVDGKLATGPTYPQPVQTVTATVGGVPASVNYAGAAPGFVAGVMQVNLQIPSGVRPGAVNVQLTIGTATSQFASIVVSQ